MEKYYIKYSEVIKDYFKVEEELKVFGHYVYLTVEKTFCMEKIKAKRDCLNELFSNVFININDDVKEKFLLTQNKVRLTRLINNIQRVCELNNSLDINKELEECVKNRYLELKMKDILCLYKDEDYTLRVTETNNYLKFF